MNPQLKDFTLEQLKSMAYDEIGRLEFAQNNLKVLNQEIQERLKAEREKAEKEKEKES